MPSAADALCPRARAYNKTPRIILFKWDSGFFFFFATPSFQIRPPFTATYNWLLIALVLLFNHTVIHQSEVYKYTPQTKGLLVRSLIVTFEGYELRSASQTRNQNLPPAAAAAAETCNHREIFKIFHGNLSFALDLFFLFLNRRWSILRRMKSYNLFRLKLSYSMCLYAKIRVVSKCGDTL